MASSFIKPTVQYSSYTFVLCYVRILFINFSGEYTLHASEIEYMYISRIKFKGAAEFTVITITVRNFSHINTEKCENNISIYFYQIVWINVISAYYTYVVCECGYLGGANIKETLKRAGCSETRI